MLSASAVFFLGLLTLADGDEALRRSVLNDLNSARVQAGLAPLEEHPALTDVAAWRASVVAASNSAATEVRTINQMTHRLRRGGYIPHNWIQSVLIGGGSDAMERLRLVRPEWYESATTGDFEHVGVGVAWTDGKAVVSVVVALRRHTVEWRRAAPLADLEQVGRDMLEAVNAVRAEHGRPPVRLSPKLTRAAQRHAEDMLERLFYDHVNPDGNTVADRVRVTGYRGGRSVSENIAKGLFETAEVVDRWMNSSGHRRNILRRGFTELGVGVAFGDNDNGFEVIWVQVFADGS